MPKSGDLNQTQMRSRSLSTNSSLPKASATMRRVISSYSMNRIASQSLVVSRTGSLSNARGRETLSIYNRQAGHKIFHLLNRLGNIGLHSPLALYWDGESVVS